MVGFGRGGGCCCFGLWCRWYSGSRLGAVRFGYFCFTWCLAVLCIFPKPFSPDQSLDDRPDVSAAVPDVILAHRYTLPVLWCKHQRWSWAAKCCTHVCSAFSVVFDHGFRPGLRCSMTDVFVTLPNGKHPVKTSQSGIASCFTTFIHFCLFYWDGLGFARNGDEDDMTCLVSGYRRWTVLFSRSVPRTVGVGTEEMFWYRFCWLWHVYGSPGTSDWC